MTVKPVVIGFSVAAVWAAGHQPVNFDFSSGLAFGIRFILIVVIGMSCATVIAPMILIVNKSIQKITDSE